MKLESQRELSMKGTKKENPFDILYTWQTQGLKLISHPYCIYSDIRMVMNIEHTREGLG